MDIIHSTENPLCSPTPSMPMPCNRERIRSPSGIKAALKRANMMVRKYRLKRHLVLALAAALLVAAFYEAVGFSPEPWTDIPDFKADDQIWRLSISLAYSTLIFLGAVLVIGPFYVLRGRSIPAGNNLRRDVGIWTAVLGLAPVVFGSVVHTREMPVLAAVS